MGQLDGTRVTEDKISSCLRMQDLAVRAESMLELADELGCKRFVSALGISSGKEKDKNIVFVAQLFEKYPKVGPSLDQLQKQLQERQQKLEQEMAKSEALKKAKDEAETSLVHIAKRLDEMQSQAARQEKNVEDLLEQIRKLKQRVAELEAENARLKGELDGTQKALVVLEQELNETAEAWERERGELEQQLDETRRGGMDQESGLLKEISRLTSETKKEKLAAAQFGKKLKQATDELKSQKTLVQEQTTLNKSLEDQVAQLKNMLEMEKSKKNDGTASFWSNPLFLIFLLPFKILL